MQTRIIAFLGIYIAAQEATETTAPFIAAALCLLLLDIACLFYTKKGLLFHLKKQEKQ